MRRVIEHFIKFIIERHVLYVCFIAVAIANIITALFSIAFNGTIAPDYVVTGSVTAFIVTFILFRVIKSYQKRLEHEISLKAVVEKEQEKLIADLKETLELLQQEMTLKVSAEQENIKLEKLKTIRQLMVKVNHYVGNLANNLQLVEYEIRDDNEVNAETLSELKRSISKVSREMKALTDIEDPFDEKNFKIKF